MFLDVGSVRIRGVFYSAAEVLSMLTDAYMQHAIKIYVHPRTADKPNPKWCARRSKDGGTTKAFLTKDALCAYLRKEFPNLQWLEVLKLGPSD